jgi:hypothetical protein
VTTDFEGDSRPQGGAVDIGFDEFFNLAPTAAGDSYSTSADEVLVVFAPGVLANDADPNLDTLTAVHISGPVTGTLNFIDDGSFSYSPTQSYAGPVTFTYQATDGDLNSTTATVTITVTPAEANKLYLPLVSK